MRALRSRLRRIIFVPTFALIIAMLAVPTHACAQGLVTEHPYPNCPTYDVLDVATADGTYLSVDMYGRFLLGTSGEYFVFDEPSAYGAGSYLFSFWIYEESNGVPGLQRSDEICDQSAEFGADAQWC